MSKFSKYIPEDLAKELYDVGLCFSYLTLTYGEVIDWFSSKGIHITFDAFFTFALADNVGYLWKVSYIDKSNGDKKLKNIFEVDVWNGKEGYGGSFELDAQSAIRYAINLKKLLYL